MSTRLILVRHGQIPANVQQLWHGSTDEALTERGREQAQRVAAYIARTRPRVAAVYTSPAQRARATADPIAAALGVQLIEAPGLAEYAIGVLEGTSFAELSNQHRFFEQTDADLSWAPPDGESLGAVAARVVDTWHEIARANPDAEVVVVSHGAAIAIGLNMMLHGDPRGWARYTSRNASVSEIVLDEPSPQLVSLNIIEHLE
jgi:broad specificity phosphatase PhoE